MKRLLLFSALAAVAIVAATTIYLTRPETYPDTQTLAVAEVVQPSGHPRSMVFLFSDQAGYGAKDERTARAIARSGAAVVGIDLARTFAKIEAAGNDDCAYFIADVEKLSQMLQRSMGMTSYIDPIVAGAGAGGTMVLSLAGQSPLATIGRFVAVDPGEALPLGRELCSGAPHRRTADGKGWIYDLQAGQSPAPIDVFETAAGDPAGKAHVTALTAAGFTIRTTPTRGDAEHALEGAVATMLAAAPDPANDALSDLPLAVLPARPLHHTMAIVLSGDGGWRDIDRQLAEFLSESGVPTVGVDSLRYFWSEKPPETIAADLSRIVDHYGDAWKVHSVVLVGYSFGADVLPAAYDRLSADEKAKITTVSLLGLSASAAFEFDVSGWLGMSDDTSHPTLPDVARMPPRIVQCVYGEEDEDSICPKLKGTGVEIVETRGGHHFDDDYEALARKILARIG